MYIAHIAFAITIIHNYYCQFLANKAAGPIATLIQDDGTMVVVNVSTMRMVGVRRTRPVMNIPHASAFWYWKSGQHVFPFDKQADLEHAYSQVCYHYISDMLLTLCSSFPDRHQNIQQRRAGTTSRWTLG